MRILALVALCLLFQLHPPFCSDGVDCSDEQHSQNRRAEIKVQMEGNR